MREIKFKALRLKSDYWEYGHLFINHKRQAFIDQDNWKREPVRIETVGQYTGLKDWDGKEIYEGDIVEIDCGTYKDKGVIQFNDGMFYCFNYGFEHAQLNPPDLEVIGNIYENPDLLENI